MRNNKLHCLACSLLAFIVAGAAASPGTLLYQAVDGRELAQVLGGTNACWIDGSSNCPAGGVCENTDCELSLGLWKCPAGTKVNYTLGSYDNAQETTEDPGYVRRQDPISVYCLVEFNCNGCWISSHDCKKGNATGAQSAQRNKYYVDPESDPCNQ